MVISNISNIPMGVSENRGTENRGTLFGGGPFEGILFYLGYERGAPNLFVEARPTADTSCLRVSITHGRR